MLEKLNNINFNNISNNLNLGIEVGREIQNASWIKSPFFSITGTGADRGVRLFSVASQQPFRPRIKAQLSGSGVSGNTDFEANYDNLEILSQTIYPDAFGNSLRSKIKAYSELERIDFIKESVDSLTTWMNEERDKRIVASLTNDFTNYLYTQTMNVATIRKAIFHARNGLKGDNSKAFPIKPIRATMQSVGNVMVQNTSYIILLDSYQANQLKADSEFKELRKLYAFAGEDKGMLYSGLLGVIDNCPVIDAGVWNKFNVGMPNSSISDSDFMRYLNKANVSSIVTPRQFKEKLNQEKDEKKRSINKEISIGCLIGASAVLLAGSKETRFYIDETVDAGRKSLVGVDCLLGVSKARYQSTDGVVTPYDNQDYAVIGLVSDME
ncbi:structural protein [Helicobacter phage KHP30]|uniref:Major structural protein ORF14 n=1 Tax=Helicobacter pylori bacteriophage KHP30 TaxID=1208236 RepID=ORF14_BPKHP|nr:major head protein [Helicobacter phage KHP30]I7H0H9.1 RecName: Full=Major structural protein ORF14 [Helicobacter phage KHP30]7DN2_a Chain a, Major structural protein ORF14 [Helicobacter phage KHP30]7DN2_b Chain b, Major structural protein ORF14 [Helicobacter phage KHP30]7DN2_c Chain c, Major structural protein ORF14 [Helicobacter phage KHP30]7DN2_d Chain d, Major structural protein ORF14 [Helicobacter phage KHP30]7DN2_e Chain e, Major structural protein ORF14 [Helicobacter phage KHP30]7DN